MALILNLWEICEWDGGDRHNSTGIYFNDEAESKTYKHLNRHDQLYKRELVIVNNMKEFEAYQAGAARRAALAKLTDKDKEILGLKD